MQIQVDIGFEQLVKIAKRLPENQWTKLKEEDENQLHEIAKTRKAINQWRKE